MSWGHIKLTVIAFFKKLFIWLCWVLDVSWGIMGSLVMVQDSRAHGLSSSSRWAKLPCGMWDLCLPIRDPNFLLAWLIWDILFPCLGLGLTLLEDRFFTTGPPGKTHLKLTLAWLKYSLDQLFLYKRYLTRNNYCGYFQLVSEYCQP